MIPAVLGSPKGGMAMCPPPSIYVYGRFRAKEWANLPKSVHKQSTGWTLRCHRVRGPSPAHSEGGNPFLKVLGVVLPPSPQRF